MEGETFAGGRRYMPLLLAELSGASGVCAPETSFEWCADSTYLAHRRRTPAWQWCGPALRSLAKMNLMLTGSCNRVPCEMGHTQKITLPCYTTGINKLLLSVT